MENVSHGETWETTRSKKRTSRRLQKNRSVWEKEVSKINHSFCFPKLNWPVYEAAFEWRTGIGSKINVSNPSSPNHLQSFVVANHFLPRSIAEVSRRSCFGLDYMWSTKYQIQKAMTQDAIPQIRKQNKKHVLLQAAQFVSKSGIAAESYVWAFALKEHHCWLFGTQNI